MKKIYLLIFFILISICLSNPVNSLFIKKNIQKCKYGKEYIKGQCLLPNFNMLPETYIDDNGIYKYIQIKCDNIIFIRGRKDCKYHKNIFNKFLKEVNDLHLDTNLCKVLGGGRINKSLKNKKIKIYGYSNRYGRAPNQHQITKNILSKFYKDDDITWSNEGY